MTKPPSQSDAGLQATLPISGDGPAKDGPPLFADGKHVADRYVVGRFLARGGMGEVYEVEDLELHEHVALKTIMDGGEDVETRFKREIQLARRVTHRNVCRIFDVGYEEQDGRRIVFLTMELLRGRTLLEQVKRDGPMPLGEASRIVRQVIAGLMAAHAANVVHGDLKSANVMLVPRKDALRVAITDFGLARHTMAGKDGGEVLGTPAYMAPEQVEGGALTIRSDLYALGVVMYEIMTATLPFAGSTPLEVAMKRLTEPAPSPKLLRADLPLRWERTILACLERDPEKRPASAREVLVQLELATDSIEDIDGTVRIAKARRHVPLVRPALGLLLLVLLLFFGERWYERRHQPAARSLAALPFLPTPASTSQDPGLGSIAAELVRARLGGGTHLQVLDGALTRDTVTELGVAQRDAELERLHAALGVELFVLGTFEVRPDGNVRLEGRLVDAKTRKELERAHVEGPRPQLARLLGELSDRLGRKAGFDPTELRAEVDLTLPEGSETLRLLTRAEELIARNELSDALAEAIRATTEEPAYARAHLLVADLSHRLGNERRAEEEAQRATALATVLPARERLFIEGAAAVLLHDHALALARLEALHGEVPSDADIAVRLVEARSAAGHADASLALIGTLRRDEKSPVQLHQLDVLEAEVDESIGAHEKALVARRRAEEGASAMSAAVARAGDLYAECRILAELDRTSEARAACIDARAGAGQTGERRLRAQAVNQLASLDFWSGETDAAERAWLELLPSARELGDQELELTVLSSLGDAALQRHDIDAARRWWVTAVEAAEPVHNELAGDAARQSLAELELEDGRLAIALPLLERVERVYRDHSSVAEYLGIMCAVADVHMALGHDRQLEMKRTDIEAVRARATTLPDVEGCTVLDSDFERGRGHADRAATALRAAIEARRKSGTKVGVAGLRLDLAAALEDAGDATGELEALEALDREGLSSDDDVLLVAQLMRLRLHPTARGRADLTRLEAAIVRQPLRYVQAAERLELERTRAALGVVPQAMKALGLLAQRARASGWVRFALETELHAMELAAAHRHAPSPAAIKAYAARARSASVSGWADRVEALSRRR